MLKKNMPPKTLASALVLLFLTGCGSTPNDLLTSKLPSYSEITAKSIPSDFRRNALVKREPRKNMSCAAAYEALVDLTMDYNSLIADKGEAIGAMETQDEEREKMQTSWDEYRENNQVTSIEK